MSSLKILGKTKDLRTNTNVVYAQINISDYLDLVGEDFDRFAIQRRREKHKAYKRMSSDIVKGALLPPITLAISPEKINPFVTLINRNQDASLVRMLRSTDSIYILDGLQRTYIIHDLVKVDKVILNKDQKLLLEFWFEGKIEHLIYRLIILNAGQKPMSMRHQVELLFMTAHEKLTKDIANLEITKERDESRRSKAKQFPFDRIVTAFYSFLNKTPEVRRDNIVVQQMNEDDILFSDESDLAESFKEFEKYLKKYCILDEHVFRIYSSSKFLKGAKNWLVDENVINSFFAAISNFGSDARKIKRVNSAIDSLISELKIRKIGEDPLGLAVFNEVKTGLNPKRENVGFATRKLIMNGFKEYFREIGDIEFSECWKMSAE
jgi:hypothetical protein